MDIQHIKSLANSEHFKITAVLAIVLLTGFIAQNFPKPSEGFQDNEKFGGNGGAPTLQQGAVFDSRTRAEAENGESIRSDFDAVSANIDIEVQNIEASERQISDLTGQYAGIVERSSIRHSDTSSSGHLSVKIPKSNYTEFLEELEGYGEIESRNVNVENLEDRYTELRLELDNKRQELNRLEELINQTDEVESLISIQERMSELRSRIQYLENRLSDLDRRIDYVEINIELSEPENFASEFNIMDAITDSYDALISSIRLIIVGTGYLMPFAVIYGIYRSVIRRRD